ncbi:MAG: chromate transporter [Parasporobacterium sp.]|nr:chromate transporter [Parasporobacterium sp.]
MIYLQLFWEFFKTGLFSIGGGMATIPFLQDMAVSTGWFNSAQLADMIAVAESTPGPLGVNTATYVGYTTGTQVLGTVGGILGAVIATLGLVAPSIIVIIIIACILDKFRKNRYVDSAFYGLRPASVGLIAAAGVSIIFLSFLRVDEITDLFTKAQFNVKYVILAVVILVLTNWVPKVKKLHPIFFILFAAVVGIVFKFGQ